MAAGGWKIFTAGDVLTADDTMDYLQQGVLVFDSSGARGSAIASPAEGQFSYLKDSDATEYYDGAAWTPVAQGGLVHIVTESFSAVSSVSLDNCFSGDYDNYRVLVNMPSLSAGMTVGMRLRASGADDSVAGYDTYYIDVESTSSAVGRIVGQTSWQIAAGVNGYQLSIGADVRQPYTANHKHVQDIWGPTVEPSGTFWRFGLRGHVRTSTTLYDGFSLLASTGNFTGTVSVYGYKK